MKALLLSLFLLGSTPLFGQVGAPIPAPSKQTPPPGIAIAETDRKELGEGARVLAERIAALGTNPAHLALLPDIEIFHKAVHDALEHDEFFHLKQVAEARALLAEGMKRATALESGEAPWSSATGLVVRGYRSKIDGSVQPYGLVIPPEWKPEEQKSHPLYSWFHGRSENLTELAFLSERMKKPGEFTPDGAFVLHLYGRFCNASKFAGETDFFEALASTRARYPIDPERLVVIGFSMGGASVWHLATHHAGLFTAASAGAGFAETAQYNKVFAPGKQPPPWWEQKLWRLYDATAYAENLSNTTLLAYSGELDPQIQAAEIMEKAAAAEGLTLERLIGPQTAHKYEPQTKKEIERRLATLVLKGRDPLPSKVRFSTYTLRYNKMAWIELDALDQHWERARIEAEIAEGHRFTISTKNVAAFSIVLPAGPLPLDLSTPPTILIDSQELAAPSLTQENRKVHFRRSEGKWSVVEAANANELSKRHGLTGPIDDAFMQSFLFIRPTGKPFNEKTGAWVESELGRAIGQWRTVFRGEARVRDDTALTDQEIADSNLVLWGDPSSNAVLAKILSRLPLQWDAEKLLFGKLNVAAANHVPILIFPNPLNPRRYVVLNSTFTFREGSSQTNSQQTPKLPDWAIVNLDTPPNKKAPGAIVDAGFFNEQWQ